MEQSKKLSIKNWSEEDRPREKLILKGRNSLSPAELIAILIGSGTKKESAVEVAKSLLQLANNNLSKLAQLEIKELEKIKGIGNARAVTIAAALELGRRIKAEKALENKTISTSEQAFEFFQSYLGDLSHEESHFVTLNNANKIIAHHKTSQGGMAGTVMDPRLILKQALLDGAVKIIIAHNHPSGNTKPSDADVSITKKIKESARLMDISLLDHIIITQKTYYSFADEGIL